MRAAVAAASSSLSAAGRSSIPATTYEYRPSDHPSLGTPSPINIYTSIISPSATCMALCYTRTGIYSVLPCFALLCATFALLCFQYLLLLNNRIFNHPTFVIILTRYPTSFPLGRLLILISSHLFPPLL